MQIHQHVLLKPGLAIVDANAIVMSVKPVDERVDRWFVEMTEIGGCLSGFLIKKQRLVGDQAEGIDDNFALDGLYRVDNDGDGAFCEPFKGFLRIDVDGGKPATETGMGMIPTNNCFWSVQGGQRKKRKDQYPLSSSIVYLSFDC